MKMKKSCIHNEDRFLFRTMQSSEKSIAVSQIFTLRFIL